jgi:hypothetical protein
MNTEEEETMIPLPKINMEANETGCCPRFEPEAWDEQIIEFDDLFFAKAQSRSFMHVPLNLGQVMARAMEAIEDSGVQVKDRYFILSRDISPWKAEHLFLVSGAVDGYDTIRLSGRFASKVFEGPFKDQPIWIKEMEAFVENLGEESEEIYAFYTTCPKCAEHYGKNYVVMFSELQ